MDRDLVVKTALESWCRDNGIRGLSIGEVLSRSAGGQPYLALTVLYATDLHEPAAALALARRFGVALAERHPELGREHLTHVSPAPLEPAERRERLKHALDFARAQLEGLAGAKGVLSAREEVNPETRGHGQQAGSSLTVLILRNDVDNPRRLREDTVAEEIEREYALHFPERSRRVAFAATIASSAQLLGGDHSPEEQHAA